MSPIPMRDYVALCLLQTIMAQRPPNVTRDEMVEQAFEMADLFLAASFATSARPLDTEPS